MQRLNYLLQCVFLLLAFFCGAMAILSFVEPPKEPTSPWPADTDVRVPSAPDTNAKPSKSLSSIIYVA